jgi:thiaminase/transcriptional activator TenA
MSVETTSTESTVTAETQNTLTEELWAAGAPIYDRILEHPFLTGLTSGELDTERFSYYLVQDSHYLREYARALSVLSSRAPDTATTALFAGHAATAIAIEMGLHTELLAEVGADASSDGPSPTTVAYTSYLLAATQGGSFAEGVAAVLPCYWIYWAVGSELAGTSSPNPAYARWIDTYVSPEFSDAVRAVLEVTDRLADEVTAAERAKMIERFRTASRYEWMFWDAAYRKETWPV